MSNVGTRSTRFRRRAKKAPEKAMSQGGEGHDTFSGAIGRSATLAAFPTASGWAFLVYPKRAAGLRASSRALRGPQGIAPPRKSPGADPSTWIKRRE